MHGRCQICHLKCDSQGSISWPPLVPCIFWNYLRTRDILAVCLSQDHKHPLRPYRRSATFHAAMSACLILSFVHLTSATQPGISKRRLPVRTTDRLSGWGVLSSVRQFIKRQERYKRTLSRKASPFCQIPLSTFLVLWDKSISRIRKVDSNPHSDSINPSTGSFYS